MFVKLNIHVKFVISYTLLHLNFRKAQNITLDTSTKNVVKNTTTSNVNNYCNNATLKINIILYYCLRHTKKYICDTCTIIFKVETNDA